MARRCEFTGKDVLSGNNVSHANNKTRRRFLPNLQEVSLMSDVLGTTIKVRLSTYLLSASETQLGSKARELRRRIKKAAEKQQAATA